MNALRRSSFCLGGICAANSLDCLASVQAINVSRLYSSPPIGVVGARGLAGCASGPCDPTHSGSGSMAAPVRPVKTRRRVRAAPYHLPRQPGCCSHEVFEGVLHQV